MLGAASYSKITHSEAPVRKLVDMSDQDLKDLDLYVEGLPNSGVPMLISALVTEEIKRRFGAGVCGKEVDA